MCIHTHKHLRAWWRSCSPCQSLVDYGNTNVTARTISNKNNQLDDCGCSSTMSILLQHGYIHHHHHLSLNHEGHWGTTVDFATSFLHLSLFSTALWDLVNSRPVHSLMLSSHLLLCLPCLLPPFTVPCKMVLARPDERETWPYHCSLRLLQALTNSLTHHHQVWLFPCMQGVWRRFHKSFPGCVLFCFLNSRSGHAYLFHSSRPRISPQWLSELRQLWAHVPWRRPECYVHNVYFFQNTYSYTYNSPHENMLLHTHKKYFIIQYIIRHVTS